MQILLFDERCLGTFSSHVVSDDAKNRSWPYILERVALEVLLCEKETL